MRRDDGDSSPFPPRPVSFTQTSLPRSRLVSPVNGLGHEETTLLANLTHTRLRSPASGPGLYLFETSVCWNTGHSDPLCSSLRTLSVRCLPGGLNFLRFFLEVDFWRRVHLPRGLAP